MVKKGGKIKKRYSNKVSKKKATSVCIPYNYMMRDIESAYRLP